MSNTHPPTHLLGVNGAMRPQIRLLAANGRDHPHTTGGVPGPAVVPLGAPYLDVDLAAMERHAQRRAKREAERVALDAMLRERAERHVAERGTLLDLPRAARTVAWLYLGTIGAVAGLMLYAWSLQP